MGILDGIVEWIAEQVMNGLDLVTTSVLGALGCDMAVFLRYFPAADTMYQIFVALAIGIILLNWIWQLFKNFGLGAGIEAEDPVKLSIRSVLFILLAYFSDDIVNTVLKIGGTPYNWILDSELPPISFASFSSVATTIIGVVANGGVALIVLILVLILAWNYLKLLFEAAERYVLLGVLVYTAPVVFSMSCVFQNLAGLQNRYPQNLWQEILGNADVQLFLGCTDPLTAEFVSSRTGLASVAVSSKSKQLGTWRISNYTPEFRETSGVGKRPVLTPDEVLRLPIDKALVIIRGKKTLKVDKMDYSKHPDYPLLRSCKASAHVPEWRRMELEAEGKKTGTQKAEPQKKTETQSRTGAQKTAAQKTTVQKSAEQQKNKVQNAKEDNAGAQNAKAGQVLPKNGAGAGPQDSGKEAKAAPRTESKAASKEPAKNTAKQTVEKKASGDVVTKNTIPEGAALGKVSRTTGKPKPKTEPGVKTGSAQPAGVVLTDKDSIML